jgi:flagellar biosynthesis protein FlhB
LFKAFPLILAISGVEIAWKFSTIKTILATSVFALVIILGYIHVFIKRHKQQKEKEEDKEESKEEPKKQEKKAEEKSKTNKKKS